MIKLKFIVIGESTVGKTSLITQFNINEFTEDYILTVGTDKIIKEIEINDQKIEMEIWDTPGQAVYAVANKIFMKNTDIALIVYDITKKETFEKIGHWINVVKEVNPNGNFIIGIAANKSDLYENVQVTNDEAKEYMNSIKDITDLFFETSATDHENVENVFNKLINTYIEKYGLKGKKTVEKTMTNNQNNSINNNNDNDNQLPFDISKTNNNNSNTNDMKNDDNLMIEDDDKSCSSKCKII